jgi:hypothetical protein
MDHFTETIISKHQPEKTKNLVITSANNIMSSTKIIINNQYCYGDSYGIDRTMPAIMVGRMSEHEWRRFCNQVDQLIVPLNKFRRLLTGGGCFWILASFIICSLLFALFESFYVIIFPLVIIGGVFVLHCYVPCATAKAFGKVRQVCESTSRNNPEISFHLRNDETDSYIEVSLRQINVVSTVASAPISRVNVAPVNDLEADYPTFTSSSAQVPPTNESCINMSVEQRMEKLQHIKHMLTTQEYEEKRKEILAEI